MPRPLTLLVDMLAISMASMAWICALLSFESWSPVMPPTCSVLRLPIRAADKPAIAAGLIAAILIALRPPN